MKKLTTLCICAFLGFSIISEKASAQCTPYIFAIPQTTNCNSNTINFNVYCSTIFDFNTGVLPAGWDSSPFVIGSPCVNTSDNSPYLWTTTPGTNDTRYVVTHSVDASAGGYIVFDMRYGAYDDVSGCGFYSWPDGEVFLQYSNNNGAWVNWAHWVPNIWDSEDPIHAWNTYVISIPLGAFGPNTHFRWFQPDNAGADYDNWGLDDIYIIAALGGNVSYLWDFGDGTTSTAVSELHTYTNSGQYTVTLTITYSPNNVVTLTKTLNINIDGALSGTYTIGGSSSDFVDIASAVSQMQTCGVSGPVVFNISTDIYTEQVTIPVIGGSSAINTITFQSASGDSTDVVIQYSANSSADNWVVKLDGADYISFKNLTIKATGASYAYVVHLTNGAEHNVFENNIIQSITSTSSSAHPVVLDAGAVNQYNTFENNVIEGGSYGIYCIGDMWVSGLYAQSNVFKGNEIKDFYYYGAYFQFQNSLQFDDNIVDNQVGSNYVYGTYFYYCDNIHVVGNKVNIHGTTSHFGIWLSSCEGLIANNFVSLTGIGTATWHGLDVHNSDHLNIYYNSVNLIGGSTISRALYQEGNNQNYKNNIFINSGGGYSAYFSTHNATVSSDYNDYYTTGTNLAYWNGNRANLADLQTASGKDAHSISVDPTFNSGTDLHTSNAFIDNAGTPIPGIIDDIDGETRDITTPDIGADEHMDCTFLAVDAGPDETTYFGSPGDQTVVRTAIVSGGTPPYSFSWTLGRSLLCNQVNADGDEQFFGGTCTNNICPTTGSPTETALCSGSDSITAVLLDTASICVTVTDANGCTATDCFTLNASDARCFAGNSGNHKIKMCHHTNNPNNPWVEICVDTSAIDAHLAHGDSIGSCDNLKMSGIEVHEEEFTLDLKLFPNPTSGLVTLEFNGIDEQSYFIDLMDRTGRKLATYKGKAIHGLNSRQLSLAGLEPGIYLFKLNLNDKQEVKKLLRE